MTKKRFELTQRFNNKFYGFKGGEAYEIKGIDQFGKLILGKDILDIEYENTSKTTWATKYFEVDMSIDAFYKVVDKNEGYIYQIENGEYKIFATYKKAERAEIFEIMKDKLGITNLDITEDNAEIVATVSEDTYSLRMTKFSYDILADIKGLTGRKYNPINKEWIVSKEYKEEIDSLGLKIFYIEK